MASNRNPGAGDTGARGTHQRSGQNGSPIHRSAAPEQASRRIIGRRHLRWRVADGAYLLSLGAGRPLARVLPDQNWPGMWRVHGRGISDLANLSRAKDAATRIVLGRLNCGREETVAEWPRTAANGSAGVTHQEAAE